jgi:nucleotide-binding universal stress UspA family protein
MGRLAGDPTALVEMTTYQKEINEHNRATQQTADSVAEILREKFPDLNITSKAIHKAPANALIEEAQKLDARFVVVGNKHVQGASRMLGSVATAVARHIKTDLYIAHTR